MQSLGQALISIYVFSRKLLEGAWLFDDEDSSAKYVSSSPPFFSELWAFPNLSLGLQSEALYNTRKELLLSQDEETEAQRSRSPPQSEQESQQSEARALSSKAFSVSSRWPTLRAFQPNFLYCSGLLSRELGWHNHWGVIPVIGIEPELEPAFRLTCFLLYDGVKVYPCGHSVLPF